MAAARKPHAVCLPYPTQGHITPLLKFAKLLHSKGLHITFVLTDYNRRRLLRSRGPRALDGVPGFRFAAMPDGLPYSDADATQDIPALCYATITTFLAPFKRLVAELDGADGDPPATCLVIDGVMTFALDAGRDLGLPSVIFWTASSCGFMGYYHYQQLIDRGLVPLEDESQLSNGYLETPLDWTVGLSDGIRLRDMPSFVRTTDRDDIMLNYFLYQMKRAPRASAFVVNTFDDFEHTALQTMANILPPIYTVGPMQLLIKHHVDESSDVGRISSSLWSEQRDVMLWLKAKEPRSVVYVNYGSITVMSKEQLLEFAWGLEGCGYDFLWVVRPDLVKGDTGALPPEFLAAIEGRGLLANWCPQEEVLGCAAVGVFLTHSGWNSTLDAVCGEVPMLSWPFFAEQQTNCYYCHAEWGIGMEIGGDVKRSEVSAVIREAMGGEKGKEMRRRAAEWKAKAEAATSAGGSSFVNFDALMSQLRLTP